ncbi:protein MIS12 homolog [Oryza brachyantha]|uniref:Protein MIS12 homolog n=1 Tax=Oryza brachyantha TaxID=4533 RepID=J3LEV2_ORYBR|nr:protein MIS12 homolog [Oryza brachyantha]
MEESDESPAATAEVEAALGLNAPLFVNSVLNAVDDVRYGAFEYCLQEGAPEAVGAATATQKAEELERGVISIHNLVKDVLDKRMSNWEKYCLRHCFAIPEGFLTREDHSSSAKGSLNDGNSDLDLDEELVSLRKKLEYANNESEELQRDISSLERQAECQRNLGSCMAELLKVFESKSFQDNFQDLVKAIPIFHQKLKGMKREVAGSTVDQNVWNVSGLGKRKRLASDLTASTEDVKVVTNEVKKA